MKRALVAYFSAGGVTAKVAEKLTKGIGPQLFEIKPEKPYTDADLDWHDKWSGSSIEMNDADCRPGILHRVKDMDQYDLLVMDFIVWLAYHNLIQCTQA